ncbi:elongation factor P 5-aminopentanone reductase [Listeria ilorinensis]|uniref:elongation factor P 5-aminopentanone reductase n=1 Tax=Listeria ilorinensis TaxID=2867439 RepID=UPI001EF5823F|nr:SDR family oxidoreductase [Listeria ilorinensis]
MSLKDRYAFVTGASGGIGREIAKQLAMDGFHLYLQYFQGEKEIRQLMDELADLHVDLIPIQADFCNPDSLEKITATIFRLDVFIHAAGQSKYGLLEQTSDQDMTMLWDTHLRMPMRLLRSLLPKLRKSECGRIMFISSIWGEIGAAMEVAYSAVKGGQIAFCRALSKEVADQKITVNCLTPGAVDTQMMQGFSREDIEQLEADIPFGRLAKSEEIAKVVSFLVSEKAGYITGQTVGVNGGWHM